MTVRALLLLTCVALVLAPGCELVTIPLKILDALASALFFWASAPEAVPEARPVPLNEALARALEAGAEGPAFLAPEGTTGLSEAGPPPFPGAVLTSIRVVEEQISPEIRAALLRRGIRLERVDAP